MAKIQDTYRSMLEAASFASRAHIGQVRKDGKTPYAAHPCRVALVVRDIFGIDDKQVITAALLHDTLEDTTTDFDELAEQFGSNVAGWVAALSKDKRLPDDEREVDYIEALQKAPWQVHVCKLGDVFDNLMDAGSMHQSRHAHVFKRARSYLQALREVLSPPMQAPWQLVADLYSELSGDAL